MCLPRVERETPVLQTLGNVKIVCTVRDVTPVADNTLNIHRVKMCLFVDEDPGGGNANETVFPETPYLGI